VTFATIADSHDRREGELTMPNNSRIVIGVDGSALALKALEFGADEARLRHADLQVIYAYPATDTEAESRTYLEGIKASAPSTDGLEVQWLAVPGNAAEVLIEASRDAALLIVGPRGVGGFLGLIIGSVAVQCVHHSHCPVLVVRDDR
jgi:nucleotide-binding universal stress UspA family protein